MTMHNSPLQPPPPLPLLTPQQILLGPPVHPLDRVSLYNDTDFERFIQEWAYYYLQEKSGQYVRVVRLGGSGDLGRDVIGYLVDPPQPAQFDVYQCKHYADKLTPGDMWLELGKLCYFTYSGLMMMPRFYYVVAPRDIGPGFQALLDKPDSIRKQLLDHWDDKCARKINLPSGVPMQQGLCDHILAFDFSVVRHKPILEIINNLRLTPCYAPRFGGGLQLPPPPDVPPPSTPAPHETRYVEQLVAAYRDEKKDHQLNIGTLPAHPELDKHFKRSRERFYCAETLQRFARDALIGGPGFSDIQDQVFDAVVDVAEAEHRSGYKRVLDVTSQAKSTQITNHPLREYLKPRSLMGICHQLANDDRLRWVP